MNRAVVLTVGEPIEVQIARRWGYPQLERVLRQSIHYQETLPFRSTSGARLCANFGLVHTRRGPLFLPRPVIITAHTDEGNVSLTEMDARTFGVIQIIEEFASVGLFGVRQLALTS